MGIPVLILGASGSGKSASMRNFKPEDVGVLNVASKPLPFRGQLPTVNGAGYNTILKALSRPTKPSYVIDDSQYLMANEFFDRAREKGYDKFTDIGLNFRNLIQFIINSTPPEVIVYLLHHTEQREDGTLKAKTIGKMLDEKLTVEGLFSIVLLCKASKEKHVFVTQGDGGSTAKSPMEMFPEEIDNDLAMVDATIREYYGLTQTTPEPEKNATQKKEDK